MRKQETALGQLPGPRAGEEQSYEDYLKDYGLNIPPQDTQDYYANALPGPRPSSLEAVNRYLRQVKDDAELTVSAGRSAIEGMPAWIRQLLTGLATRGTVLPGVGITSATRKAL